MTITTSTRAIERPSFSSSIASPLLRDQIESSPDMLFRINSAGRILDCRPGRGVHAYSSPEEFLNRSLDEVLAPETAAILSESIGKAIAAGHSQFCVYSTNFGDTKVDYEVRLVPASGDEIVAFVRNLTEEASARRSQRMLELMFVHLPTAVILIDKAGIIKGWGGASELTFGYCDNDAVGKDISELVGFTNPEVLTLADSPDEGISSLTLETEARHSGGQPIELLVKTVKTLDHDGGCTGVMLICNDLTAQRQAEAMAGRIRKQREAILNNIPDIAWMKDTESRYVMANEPFAKACGLTPEEIPGKIDYDLWPREIAEKYRRDDREVMKSRQGKKMDEPIVWADGTSLIIETIKNPIYDIEGNVIGTTGIARDVTVKARAEKALRESETRYRTLFESSVSAFLLLSDFRIKDCNERAHSMFGISHDAMLEKTISELSPQQQPDGKPSEETLRMRIEACHEGAVQHFNWRFLGVGDEILETEISIKPLNLATEPTFFVEIRDVTLRLQAELKVQEQLRFLQQLIDSIPTPIFYKDSEDVFLGCNKSFAESVGKTRSEILGVKTSDLFPPEEAALISEHDVRLLNEGKMESFECKLTFGDGQVREVLFYEAAFRLRSGASGGLVGTILDITDRKRFEQELRNSEERLREAQAIGLIGHWEMIVATGAIIMSDQLYRIFGIPRDPSNRSDRSIYEEFFGDHRLQVREAFERCLLDTQPFNLDSAITLRTGQVRHVQLQARPVVNEEGQVVRLVGTLQDITDRKTIEIALRESEERFRVAIVNSGMIVSHQDKELRYEWIYNPGPRLDLDAVHFDTREELFWSEEASRIVELKKRVLASGVGERAEITAIVGNEKRQFDLIVEPRRDTAERILGITNVAIDITDRKKIERSLMESHRLLTAIMKNLPGMIYRCRNDVDRTLEFASEGCTGLTGFDPEDLIGNKKLSLAGLLHPDDRETTNRQLQSALDAKEPYELSYRILTASGEVRWVWEHGWAEDSFSTGRVVLQGLILDISHQRAEDERRSRLTTAVEQAAEAIMITDVDGKIEYVNPAFEEVTGYTQAEVIGQTPRLLKSGQHGLGFYKELWATILRGDVWKGRLINKRKDGTLLETDSSIRAVRDAQGKIINFVAVKRDVTKLMALESQLRQAQKLEAVGALAAGIAHEINTPIQFVGDNTHFLSDTFSDLLRLLDTASELAKARASCDSCPPDVADFLKQITEADLDYFKVEIPKAIEQSLQGIDRVANIVRAMKDFSHPDKREKSTFDVNRAVRTTLTVAHNELKYVADVVEDLSPDLPALLGYPSELNQVFLNLLVNAAHAIAEVVEEGKGRGTITVRTRLGDKCVIASVSDTGIGIRPEVQDRVFEPFFTTKSVGRGTGQGLAIARSVVVEKHGGEIYFETERGKGTTFFVKLPITYAEESLQ